MTLLFWINIQIYIISSLKKSTSVLTGGTDVWVLGRVTAEIVSIPWWNVARWMSAALVSIRTPVEVAFSILITFGRSSNIVQHHITLELRNPGHFQSLDEGIDLVVTMTSTLSRAETCSNQEQGQS